MAVANIVAGFRAADRGQAIMACGTGKTLVGLLVAKATEHVPSPSLLAQTPREWTADAERAFRYLAVCSDETVVGRSRVDDE
jgi:predicted helicase